MNKNSVLKIEILGTCGLISVKDKEIYTYLKTSFQPFLSNFTDSKAHFQVEIAKEKAKTFNSIIPKYPQALDMVSVRNDQKKIFLELVEYDVILEVIDLVKHQSQIYIDTKGKLLPILISLIRASFDVFCISRGIVFLHACGVIDGTVGYLFIGDSGAGKTTISNLLSNLLLLSDDCVGVGQINENYCISGTPWNKSVNQNSAIHCLFFPRRAKNGTKLEFEEIKPLYAVEKLISNIPAVTATLPFVQKRLDFASNLVRHLPCYYMYFSPTTDLWKGIRRFMEETFSASFYNTKSNCTG